MTKPPLGPTPSAFSTSGEHSTSNDGLQQPRPTGWPAGWKELQYSPDGQNSGYRYELADRGVGVSVVVPGVIDTPFFTRRGTPYDRGRPAPIPAERVARATLAAIEHRRAEVYVPGWLRFPARLQGATPGLFRALAGRFG